jgi:hypothetical protein
MSEQSPSPIDELKALRATLVRERRQKVTHPQGPTGLKVQEVQEQIDAVDRAIEDEEKLAKGDPDPAAMVA